MMRFIGYAVYLSLCAAVVVYVSIPLALTLAAAGLISGVVAALVAVVLTLIDDSGAAVLTPAGARDGLPGRVHRRFVRRDHAWPQYFAAQVVLDARSAIDRSWAWAGTMWSRPMDWLRVRGWGGFWWPVTLVPVLATLGGASVGLAVGLGAGLLAITVVGSTAWLVGLPVVGLLRGVDVVWRLVWKSRASCTECFEIADEPAYRCRGNHPPDDRAAGDDLHRDVRPGPLGVLWRRCSCGVRLPTMVLRAAYSNRLAACCPSCGHALFDQAGVVRDVRAPVFGAASVGKTQFIMSALVGLHDVAGRAGVPVTLPDQRSRQTYALYADLVARRAPAPKTNTTVPVAVTARIEQGLNTTLVHLFDAAGETLTDSEQNAGLSYLDNAETLAFVLDPFAVTRVREEHGFASAQVFTDANASLHDPEDSYNTTTQRLQVYGVRTARRRLAFVVTKADLSARLPLAQPGPGADSAAVRAWLCAQGLDNLVVSAERDFREVRYFLVSGRDTGPDGPVAVLRWMLLKGWGNLG